MNQEAKSSGIDLRYGWPELSAIKVMVEPVQHWTRWEGQIVRRLMAATGVEKRTEAPDFHTVRPFAYACTEAIKAMRLGMRDGKMIFINGLPFALRECNDINYLGQMGVIVTALIKARGIRKPKDASAFVVLARIRHREPHDDLVGLTRGAWLHFADSLADA